MLIAIIVATAIAMADTQIKDVVTIQKEIVKAVDYNVDSIVSSVEDSSAIVYAQSVGEVEPIKENVKEAKKPTRAILVGDSRFIGLEHSVELPDTVVVIAETGKGYYYLIENALPKVEALTKDKSFEWKVVFGLGINDLKNIDEYIKTYNSLNLNADLSFLSVNPIERHSSITNEQIEKFNHRIQTETKLKFYDSYSELMRNGFDTTDGLHYTPSTYEEIYQIMNSHIEDKKYFPSKTSDNILLTLY